MFLPYVYVSNLGLDSSLDDSMPYMGAEEQQVRPPQSRFTRAPATMRRRQQSKMCVKVAVGKGYLTAYAPLAGEREREGLEEGEGSGQDGEVCGGMFVVELGEAVVFCEIEHDGDNELSFVSLHSNECALYHQGTKTLLPSHLNFLPLKLSTSCFLSSQVVFPFRESAL